MRRAWWLVFLLSGACSNDDDGAVDAGAGGGGGGGLDGALVDSGEGGGSGRVPVNHRPEAVRCDDERGPGSPPLTPIDGAECRADADCTEGDNGRCVDFRGDIRCTYDECFEDSTCDGGGPCGCGNGFWSDNNVCLGGRVDADCGADGYCSPTLGDCGDYAGVVAWYCHTAEDECTDDADCGGNEGGGWYCAYNPAGGKWVCSNAQCVG